MNIFVVDAVPQVAARALHDAHVIKMALETAQILSSVVDTRLTHFESGVRLLGDRRIYRPTHLHHPCVLWAGETEGNRNWLVSHGLELCAEYHRRFGREHASLTVITTLADHPLVDTQMTPFAQAMPDAYRGPDAVEAYRRYYVTKLEDVRGRPARWTNTSPPEWLTARQ